MIPQAAVEAEGVAVARAKAAAFAEYTARLAREAKTQARKESQVNPRRK